MRIGINALDMESASGFAKAGVSRYCFRLIDALLDLDEVNEYVVFIDPGFESPKKWRSCKNLKLVPASGRFARKKNLWNLVAAGREARKHRVDVWLSLAHVLPIGAPCPTVLTVHDLFTLMMPETVTKRFGAVVGRVLPWSIRKATHLITVSEATKRDVLRYFPERKAGQVTVTHLGPGNLVARRDPATVSDEALARIGVLHPRFLFTLSTLEPRKNLPALIEAFAEIHRDFPDVGLAVAGAKGWKFSEVFTRIQELALEDAVNFLGYVEDDDLPALFARCEAFVCASLTEGFGIPVLESQLLGAPVVCSNTGSLPEVAGPAAILFDPRDTTGMASALRQALERSEPREALVEQGLQKAAGFTWERTARSTLAALRKAVSR